MLNLILEDLTFNEKFKTFLSDNGFSPEDGKVYQTLGIIGCQSSGKSTLLNHVFNTNFEIMSDDKGRAQTTKGIWIGLNKEFNTILFDVEGTDSKERGDERFKFEQCSSLFTLAMSDVLMINMWTNDIGRYTASNYGILKVVFEQNLKLFQQESEKKIIIVLRDFDDKVDDIEKLKESIMGDMKQIWEEIPKPDAFKGKPASEFFRFEFMTLAHKFYQTEKFNEGIEKIKQRLKRAKDDNKTGNNPDSVFNLVNYEKNVPIEGLYKYTSDMWSSILNNKDLNIPGQKEMLARFKCEEIKSMSIKLVEDKINNLELESSSEILNDFKPKVEAIIKQATDNYNSLAKHYLKHIYEDVGKVLKSELSEKLYSSFSNQLKRLIPKYQKQFRNDFEKELKTNDNFYELSEKLKKKYVQKLEEELIHLKVFDNWDTGKDSEIIFNEIIENQRSICLEDKREKLIEQYEGIMEETIVNKLEVITENFWVELQQELFMLISQNLLLQKEKLNQLYKITDEEYANFATNSENEVFQKLKFILSKELPNLPNIQMDNFKKEFSFIDGIPKVWNKINLSEIQLSYSTFSNKYKSTFNIFQNLKFIEHPIKLCQYGKTTNDEIEKFEKEKIPQMINDPEGKFPILLNPETLNNYINKYEDGIKEIYEDALRKHENITSTRIPLWAWLLLIYVGYKDIWRMLTGYWLIILLLLAGCYSIMRMVGLGGAPKMIYNLVINQIKSIITHIKIQ